MIWKFGEGRIVQQVGLLPCMLFDPLHPIISLNPTGLIPVHRGKSNSWKLLDTALKLKILGEIILSSFYNSINIIALYLLPYVHRQSARILHYYSIVTPPNSS